MDVFLGEWVNLLLRWAHMIVGIGWIGTSFYFMALDYSLDTKERKSKGVYGTANWDWQLGDEASKAFTKSFGAKFGQPPSQIAQTSYAQVLLYADAVERAGTFYPPEVIKALEGYEFDGLGNGPTTYRAADHQCFKEVYAVKGKEAPANPFDLLEVVATASKESVTYDPAIFGGELGPDTAVAC